jgi:hypothetical protein
MKTVVLDIWDGSKAGEHIARAVLPLDDALEAARLELLAGYSVNLRVDMAWGSEQNFDHRSE